MFSPNSEPGYTPEEVVREMLLGRAKRYDPLTPRDTLPLKEHVETFPELERWKREEREARMANEAHAKQKKEQQQEQLSEENVRRSTSLAPKRSSNNSNRRRRQLLQARPGSAVELDAAQIELNATAVRQNPRDVNDDDDHDDHDDDDSLERFFSLFFESSYFHQTNKQKVLHFLYCASTFFHTCVSRSHPFSHVPIGFLCYFSSQNARSN
jgi:hypothetical protein